VHHRNLASFVGYCDDDRSMALIYEYMANGNLQAYLSSHLIISLYISVTNCCFASYELTGVMFMDMQVRMQRILVGKRDSI